jgi:hypothetical protein
MKTMLNTILQRIRARQRRLLAKRQLRQYSRYQKSYDVDLTFSQAAVRFPARNELHAYAHHYFHHICPQELNEHRLYFSQNGRGFGEDAFHAMWWMLFREFSPVSCLEIGVFRGQVISLWGLIAKVLDTPRDIHGISPFAPIGDTVSNYQVDLDYLGDTKKAFSNFGLPSPTLVCALSTDSSAIDHIREREWDLIYIDGCHDYEVAAADYHQCVRRLKSGGLLVMDDASLGTEFHPPQFSFAGHPGPSQVVQEFAMKELIFLGAVGHNNVFLKPSQKDIRGSD